MDDLKNKITQLLQQNPMGLTAKEIGAALGVPKKEIAQYLCKSNKSGRFQKSLTTFIPIWTLADSSGKSTSPQKNSVRTDKQKDDTLKTSYQGDLKKDYAVASFPVDNNELKKGQKQHSLDIKFNNLTGLSPVLLGNSLSPSQQRALSLMNSGKNVHLYGEAGTGKSFILKKFLDELPKEKKERTLICAPTGIAAVNIKGITLHRAFRIPTSHPLSPTEYQDAPDSELLAATDIVVIDEISMARFDLFEFVGRKIKQAEKRYKRKIQVIVIGDMLQLPPVMKPKEKIALSDLWHDLQINDGYAFQAPVWDEFQFVNCRLMEPVRQSDPTYVKNLNKARIGDNSCIEWFNHNATTTDKDYIYLCPTNQLANKKNQLKTAPFKNKMLYKTQITGYVSHKELSNELKDIELASGMKVMSTANAEGLQYTNGSMGKVIATNNYSVVVKFDNGCTSIIEPKEISVYDYKTSDNKKRLIPYKVGSYTKLPLKIAYAITIHKSQGQTLEGVRLNPNCFAKGQLYVALSRCKSINTLFLEGKIKQQHLIVSEDALNFYNRIE